MSSSNISQERSSSGVEPDRGSWKSWSVKEWNQALFDHFFSYEQAGTVRPVRTIHLAGSVWNKVAGNSKADYGSIREAFIKTIRKPPRQFRAAFSADRLNSGNEWEGNEIPPFVADLIFTCLVATNPRVKGETETNFRERVRLFMEHPEGTHYQFGDLPELWEAFSRWLDRKQGEGWPYRRLKLPYPGWETRIGYSTKLAVPEWRDQRRLSKVLEENNIGEPGVREVLAAFARSNRSFSDRFSRLYEDFREEYEGGTATWGTHPFWTAVKRAATLTWDTQSSDKKEKYDARVTYEVDSFSPHGTLNLYLTNEAVELGEETNLKKRTIAANTEWYLVRFGESSSPSENDFLSPEKLANIADVLAPQALRSGVRDGVLLFAYNEYGLRELQSFRPQPETRTWALVRESLRGSFPKLFTDAEVDIRESAFSNWVLVGPFQFQDTRPHKSWPRELADITVLQPTSRASEIHFKEGVRVPGGFMGTERFLPLISVEDANEVVLKGPLGSEESSTEKLDMSADTDTGRVFQLPKTLAPLEGNFEFLARRDHNLKARREVTFRSGLITTDYKQPSNNQDWMAEGALTDTVILEELDRSNYPAVKREQNLGLGVVDSSKRINTPPSPQSLERDVTPAFRSNKQAVTKAMRLVGAIGNRRKGIREGEFLDLIGEVFSDTGYKRRWEIARAWEEVGYVDRLTKRNWNTGKYFPRQPELVYKERKGELEATLTGISPVSLRRHLRNLAEELGASDTLNGLQSNSIAPILSWNFRGKKHLDQFAKRADLPTPKKLRALEEVASEIFRVLDLDRREEPLHYKRRGTWNWNLGEFRPESEHHDSHEIAVEWYQRKDSPDYFRVTRRGNLIWWTHSRNWALLAAHALKGGQFFHICGRWLVRTGSAQFYLPVPLARWVTVHSGHPPGPVKISDEKGYGYRCRSEGVLSRLVSLVWSRNSEDLERHLRWILQQADQSRPRLDARLVRIPSDVVEKVQESDLNVGLSKTRKVPSHLVPHLNRLADKI